MNDMNVPEQCPLLDTCDRKMVYDEFETFCLASVWVYCEDANIEVKKYEKTAREWKESLSKKGEE